MSEKTAFERLAAINVSDKTEKKNGLSYLSWAWAVDQLLRHDPMANWVYPEPKLYGETMMVFCSVTALGKTMTAQLPVMDYKNKPISNPDSFAVNTAMQRCLAKAIALHGLGLYIYAGEDVPTEDSVVISPVKESMKGSDLSDAKRTELAEVADYIHQEHAAGREVSILRVVKEIKENDEKIFLWSLLDSKVRAFIKAQEKK
jgi:Protein of unknown function (DUF1071)